jgi:hypothetical protein
MRNLLFPALLLGAATLVGGGTQAAMILPVPASPAEVANPIEPAREAGEAPRREDRRGDRRRDRREDRRHGALETTDGAQVILVREAERRDNRRGR